MGDGPVDATFKAIKELTVAARLGGGDPEANPRLRTAIDKAKQANMPKDNIERAIKKATGELEGVTYEEVRYEGYATGGVAVMVDCLTDNRNRTVADVRHAFSKHGGNLGTDGSVAYLFTKIGVLNFAPGTPEEAIMEIALEAGADDIVTGEDGSIEVQASPEAFDAVANVSDHGRRAASGCHDSARSKNPPAPGGCPCGSVACRSARPVSTCPVCTGGGGCPALRRRPGACRHPAGACRRAGGARADAGSRPLPRRRQWRPRRSRPA